MRSERARSKGRCWRYECLSCRRFLRLAFDAFALDVFEDAIARDRALGNRQEDRRLLFVTFRGRADVEWKAFAEGVEDCGLPWLEQKDRLGTIRACLGVYVSATPDASIHWHAIIDADDRLPNARGVWARDCPPSAVRWAGDRSTALDVRLVRLPGEVQPWRGDRLRTITELPWSDPSRDLVMCSVDHIRYMADQFPTPGVPPNHNCLLTRHVSHPHASGFAQYRNEQLERYRTLPYVDPEAAGLTEAECEILRACSPTREQWQWALERFLAQHGTPFRHLRANNRVAP